MIKILLVLLEKTSSEVLTDRQNIEPIFFFFFFFGHFQGEIHHSSEDIISLRICPSIHMSPSITNIFLYVVLIGSLISL